MMFRHSLGGSGRSCGPGVLKGR